MSKYYKNDEKCPFCGMMYKQFRTGLTYNLVYQSMKDCSDNPEDWKYKRRNTVLGRWYQLKKMYWEKHIIECEQSISDNYIGKIDDNTAISF